MAVIFTQADIDTLKEHIVSGVLQVEYAGPPARKITYRSMEAMLTALAIAERQVSGTPSHRLATFKKGF